MRKYLSRIFTGAWEASQIAHHSDYQTFIKSIKHTLKKGFNKNKLLVGLPTYGIEFIDGKNNDIQHIEYKKIIDTIKGNNEILNKGRYKNIFFDNKKLFDKKSQYVASKGLAGVFIFDLASDHLKDEYSLIASIKENITPTKIDKKINKYQKYNQPTQITYINMPAKSLFQIAF